MPEAEQSGYTARPAIRSPLNLCGPLIFSQSWDSLMIPASTPLLMTVTVYRDHTGGHTKSQPRLVRCVKFRSRRQSCHVERCYPSVGARTFVCSHIAILQQVFDDSTLTNANLRAFISTPGSLTPASRV